MYFIEAIAKLFLKNKHKNDRVDNDLPDSNIEKCEHVFLPIDSDSEYLACNNCGLVIENNVSKKDKNNPFEL